MYDLGYDVQGFLVCVAWEFWVVVIIEDQQPPRIVQKTQPRLNCIDHVVGVFHVQTTDPASRKVCPLDLFGYPNETLPYGVSVLNVQPEHSRVVVLMPFRILNR